MVQSFNVSLIQKTPETRETGLLDQGRYYGAGLQKFSNHQEFQRGAMHFNLTLNKSKLTTLISDTWKNFGQGYALWIIFIFYSHFQNHICGSVFIIHVLGFCNDFLTFMIQVQITCTTCPNPLQIFAHLVQHNPEPVSARLVAQHHPQPISAHLVTQLDNNLSLNSIYPLINTIITLCFFFNFKRYSKLKGDEIKTKMVQCMAITSASYQ